MKTEDKVTWINRELARKILAQKALVAAKKQAAAEYDERLRKLRDFEDSLTMRLTDEVQQELFDPETFIDPSLDRLLSSPLHGL